MATVTEYSKPGVYLQSRRLETNKISLSSKTVPGFLGIACKGPMDKAVLITDFNQYLRIFGGFNGPGYLAYSVYCFFNCGGNACYVVRTAHKGEDGACKSQLDLTSVIGKASLSLKSSSEGVWGNKIHIRLWHVPEKTIPYSVSEIDDEFIDLLLEDDVRKGDILRILYKDGTVDFTSVANPAKQSGKVEYRVLRNKYDDCVIQAMRFNISINDGIQREEYLYLSSHPDDERYYKSVLEKSVILEIDDKSVGQHKPWFPQEKNESYFAGGKDGVLNLKPGDFIGYFKGLNDNKGLGIFESIPQVNVLCAPDVKLFEQVYRSEPETIATAAHAIFTAMIDQSERMGNRFSIIEAPDTDDLMQVLRFAGKYDSANASLYYPPVEIIDPQVADASRTVYVPACGIVAGIIAGCDKNEGVYRAPAGKIVNGAVGLKYEVDDRTFETLYAAKINGYKRIPGRGIKLWGARTLSSDPEWRYINVRRTFSQISQAIKEGLGWAVFEPNNFGLRKRIVRHVTAFLIDLWRKGYLAGKTPEEAFYVICNDELNPPENIDAGIITTCIGLAITKPAEYISITLNAVKDDANVIIEEV